MKVYCPALSRAPSTGKGYFIHRLAPFLAKLGVKFVATGQKHDIDLCISSKDRPAGGKKCIVRLDGAYYKTKADPRNRKIAWIYSRADGIVYQSRFSKKLVRKYMKYLGTSSHAPSTIIPNGADSRSYIGIPTVRRPHRYQVLCVARWRPHKRLREMVKITGRIKLDIGLWVAGKVDKPIKADHVTYLGRLGQPTLSQYYKSADVTLHLCAYDNCPNTVVESIAAGTPVLCINSGGTPELVGSHAGVVSQADTPFDLNPVDVNKPRALNMQQVARDLKRLLMDWKNPDTSYIDIRPCAKQYLAFFKQVLGR